MAEWKRAGWHLEEVARKVQCQDEVNIYFREIDELDKTLSDKELWLKENSAPSLQQQPLTTLKELCQVNLFIVRCINKVEL